MFFIQFQVRPAKGSVNAEKYGGAYANFWIERGDLAAAKAVALKVLEDAGWAPECVDQERIAFSDEFEGVDLEYFEQAEIDKEVCVFHTWPKDALDADDMA